MGPTFTVHNRVLFKIIGNVLWYILYSRNKKNAHTHTFIDQTFMGVDILCNKREYFFVFPYTCDASLKDVHVFSTLTWYSKVFDL